MDIRTTSKRRAALNAELMAVSGAMQLEGRRVAMEMEAIIGDHSFVGDLDRAVKAFKVLENQRQEVRRQLQIIDATEAGFLAYT